ncbi:MAG TPA: aldehyde dehydrogenase family protein, partial [Gaiellaceae bacterium]
TEVGRGIAAGAAGTIKRVTLELGGKSPNIVFADSDLDAAVQGALLGIFLNQGEVCCAGSRLYIEASVYDDVLGRVVERAGEIALGHGLDDATEMGPLVSEEQLARVLGYLETGVGEGATIVAGGGRPDDERLRGYFVQPTVFADVRDDMRIATEEIFGPVLSVMPFDDEESLVRRANSTFYGLAAGIWTENLKRAHRLAEALKAGTVWINGYNMVDPSAPFGGFKMSGYGRELGMDAIHDYTQVKSVWVNLD